MRAFKRIADGCRRLARRARVERDLDDELQQFLDAAVEDKLRAGLGREDALRAARLEVGSIEAVKDHVRDVGWETSIEQFFCDLAYAWRTLRTSRAFATTVVLTLAVGLGLVTFMFTVFNAYVLRPFAVRDPYSLQQLTWHSKESAGSTFSWSDYEAFRERGDLFDAVIAGTHRYIDSEGTALSVAFVSGNYFDALGTRIAIGRGLTPFDAQAPGTGAVAVLSDQVWRRFYKRDPSAIGREIVLNGQKLVIVGVARAEFQGIEPAPEDLWVPVTMSGPIARQDWFGGKQGREVHVVVRLRPDVSPIQAQDALVLAPFETRVAGRLDEVKAELQEHATHVRLTPDIIVVFGPAGAAFVLVLLTACANASTVMLARANARHAEIGLRLALGASRARVVRQLLTEGLLLAGIAGVVALGIAGVALRGGMSLLLSSLPGPLAALVRIVPLDFDGRIFLFALGAATCTTVLFALLPALHATRMTLTDALRGQAGSGLRSATLRRVLVGGQVAISLVLLVVAATLVRNATVIGRADLGFDPHGVISINQRGDSKLVPRLAAALAADPRIEHAVVTSHNPLFGNFPRFPARVGKDIVMVSFMFVSPEYFSMLRIPLVHGRGFRAEEAREGSGVAIVSATAARKLWPGEDPVGKTLPVDLDEPTVRVADTIRMMRSADTPKNVVVTIVGVAQDVVGGLIYEGKGTAQLYLPTTAEGAHASALLVSGRPGVSLRPTDLRPAMEKLHPDPLKFEAIPIEQMVDVQMFPLRMASWIGSFLGAVALALSTFGLYGMLSYMLGQRATEIAIRMALGATPAVVVGLIMRQSARLAGVGAAAGLVSVYAVLKILSAVVRLEGVSVVDAFAFAAGLGLICLAVALASFGPARHAARVDPAARLKV